MGRAEAIEQFRKFRGKKETEIISVSVNTPWIPSELATLGTYLIALTIEGPNKTLVELRYSPENPTNAAIGTKYPMVGGDGIHEQLYIVGGNQNITERYLKYFSETDDKVWPYVAVLRRIAYWTTKDHLTGPARQKTGIPYEHKFGEVTKQYPFLLYSPKYQAIRIEGGAYEIREEGIWN